MRFLSAALLAAALAGPAPAEVLLRVRVTNDNNAPVPQARVTVRPPGAGPASFLTGTDGLLESRFPAPGEYRIAAERGGYFRMEERAIALREGPNDVHLILNPLREVLESIEVTASPSRIDFDRTASQQSLSGAEMLAVPFPSSNNIKNALRIMPGVVQDVRGGVHLHGSSEEQVLFTLNGFNLNDPLTGRFESRLSVESVQSVDVAGGAIAAEYGKGSAGAIAVTTTPGDDRLRYSVTNFFPGIETRKGLFIGNWSPRFNLSGPIRKGRAWFSDSLALHYDKEVIEELPKGADSLTSQRMSNVVHTQVNLTPSHILFAGFLANMWNAPRTGLNIMNPPEATLDRRSRQWFFNIKDQIYFGRGSLVEFGYAANRTFGREIPQGRDFLRITPEGNRGNAYTDAVRKGGRDQAVMNYFLPSFTRLGGHQVKTGIDLDRVSYWQDVRRTGFEQARGDGFVTRRVTFGGPASLQRTSFETSAYVQDTWRPRPSLLVEMGLRGDRDNILRRWNAAPRVGFAWAPPGTKGLKISGAHATVYETANLRLFTRPFDQYAITNYFHPDGSGTYGPAIGVFVFGEPHPPAPRSRIVSAGLERLLPAGLYLRTDFLRRRVERGFTYASIIGPGQPPAPPEMARRFGTSIFDAIYRMANNRRDVFDSLEITVRQTLRQQYGWLASYTRSRALSNGVVDVNIDDPILVSDNVGPMPWDAPHRFLSWGYLPLPWKNWAAAYLADTRSGFPFSSRNDSGLVVGKMNALRFPCFFAMNLHLERRFTFRKHRWELRAGFNNLTNRRNPTVVNQNVDSPNYLRFYGGQGRTLNFRIRWLGRAAR